MLPKILNVRLQPNVFPTTWQAVLFKNYGYAPVERLAQVLSCDADTILREAERMGLGKVTYSSAWLERGYITLIRNNWFLLPYEQICTLLGIDENRLDFILQNDDFLAVKLGNYKPNCPQVGYAPLTKEQIARTETLAKKIQAELAVDRAEPFDFFTSVTEKQSLAAKKGTRIVHGYLSPCGDAFIEDSRNYMPDGLLEEYAARGINGVWLHGVLSALSPYPFDETLSAGYELRRKNLKDLIARCQKYGVKVYLYLNEPRALAEGKFGKYSHLIGRRENGYACLCFEQKETREYLYNAVKDLLSDARDLGGIITITMSENMTHCNFLPNTNCPVCKNISPEQSTAAVNNVIYQAIRDSGSKAELLANLWGWSPYMEWTEDQTFHGVELLDKNISVMCVSEFDLDIEKGGIPSKVIDYSISNPGPSALTTKILTKAKACGHKLYAKIQTNNSWECSAVPYLPVFDLLLEHLRNLSAIGVEDYMLTWTLGGYPSPMLGMAAAYAQDPDAFDLDEWYKAEYGAESAIVKAAVGRFCQGFQEYPFSIQSLYLSPKTLACANLWAVDGQDKSSTMVCFAFDDYESWTTPYPLEVYLSQYEKLLRAWEEGLAGIERSDSEKVRELARFAQAAYAHFCSDYLQTKFAYYRRNKTENRAELLEVVGKEQDNARRLLGLLYADSRIGFEASNHYFYTDRNLIEKILLMDDLRENI